MKDGWYNCKYFYVMFAVIIPANEKSVHSGIPKLLVGKTLFGKHVRKYLIQTSRNLCFKL